MTQLLAVATGGAFGALARYGLVNLIGYGAFPWATLMINLCGSLLIGLWYALALELVVATEWRLLVQMGFLGAFTTFSTLALELLFLLEERAYWSVLVYMLASLMGGLLLVLIGMRLAQWLRLLVF